VFFFFFLKRSIYYFTCFTGYKTFYWDSLVWWTRTMWPRKWVFCPKPRSHREHWNGFFRRCTSSCLWRSAFCVKDFGQSLQEYFFKTPHVAVGWEFRSWRRRLVRRVKTLEHLEQVNPFRAASLSVPASNFSTVSAGGWFLRWRRKSTLEGNGLPQRRQEKMTEARGRETRLESRRGVSWFTLQRLSRSFCQSSTMVPSESELYTSSSRSCESTSMPSSCSQLEFTELGSPNRRNSGSVRLSTEDSTSAPESVVKGKQLKSLASV